MEFRNVMLELGIFAIKIGICLLCIFHVDSRHCCSAFLISSQDQACFNTSGLWILWALHFLFIFMFGALLWLYLRPGTPLKSPPKVGFNSPFVFINTGNLGASILVAQTSCLTILNLSPTQKTCLLTNGNVCANAQQHHIFTLLCDF